MSIFDSKRVKLSEVPRHRYFRCGKKVYRVVYNQIGLQVRNEKGRLENWSALMNTEVELLPIDLGLSKEKIKELRNQI